MLKELAEIIELNGELIFILLYISIYFSYQPHYRPGICLYCQFLSRSLTPPSIRNYLSGVRLFHLMLGFPFPDVSAHELKVTLRGIERLAQHLPQRVPPPPSPLNFFVLLCLAGLISTPPMSPFRVPICSPFSSSRVSLI